MIELNANNFDEVVIKSDKLVLVDLWAEWCGPCRVLTPALEAISKLKMYGDKITVVKCNVDDCPTIASKYGIRNIPTVLYFKNGKVVDKQVGLTSQNVFTHKIDILLQ